ncbi:hypothetical protein, partial [Weissella viridescens]
LVVVKMSLYLPYRMLPELMHLDADESNDLSMIPMRSAMLTKNDNNTGLRKKPALSVLSALI